MKRPVCWLVLVALSVLPAIGQIRVEVSADQDQFLPGEPLTAIVKVSNRSGQKLQLGSQEDWLTFNVATAEGLPVQKLADPPVKGVFALPSANRATKRVELSREFALTTPGRYTLTATVKVPGWGQETPSQPFYFNIIEGSHLWEQEFGVPGTAADKGAPEIRKYILQQANYLKNKLRLYVRITDASGLRVIKTIPVGTVLTFSHPETEVDEKSNLHLLYQSWAHSFSYFVYSPDGAQLKGEIYDYIGGKPRLGRDSDGKICVLGGVLREPEKQVSTVSPALKQQP